MSLGKRLAKMGHLTAVVLGTVASDATLAASQDDLAKSCERNWQVESHRFAGSRPGDPKYSELATVWETYEVKCKGTTAYEARLAIAYVLAGRLADAKRVLAALGPKRAPFGYLVEAAELQVATREALQGDPGETRGRLQLIEKRYRSLVSAYPEWLPGYGLLGAIQTSLGMHAEAVTNLRRGLDSDAEVSSVYRNLAISLVALGRYKEGLDSADQAFNRNPTLTADPDFMYAGAMANAGLGDFDSARMALALILRKEPRVQSDPDYARAVEFINRRQREATRRVR